MEIMITTSTIANYIEDALGGSITTAAYPAGGEGRITQLP